MILEKTKPRYSAVYKDKLRDDVLAIIELRISRMILSLDASQVLWQ